jgi:antirestriction protein ArdC
MRKIAKQISDMPTEERIALSQRLPVATIEGRTLSVFNACMLACQNPSATIVGGFRQWLKVGRAVRKGEHGAAIWVPLKPRNSVEDGDATQGDGDETRFILGTVFDVSQTDEVQTAQAA